MRNIIYKSIHLYFLTVLGISLIFTESSAKPIIADEVVSYKKINDTELKLHIFYPKEKERADLPVMVFFFGGGWLEGGIGHFHKQALYLRSRGMATVLAEYRTKKSHNVDPIECVKDGRSAMRYVYQHAEELGFDTNKVAAGGGSAGGQIAAACSTANEINHADDNLNISPSPKALVLFNPVYDNGPGGYGHDRVKDYWESFSPLHNIHKDMPPTLVMAGDVDRLTPAATMQAFQQKMKDLGIRSELILYAGKDHGFFNKGLLYNSTLKEMDLFLASLGFLAGQPAVKAPTVDQLNSIDYQLISAVQKNQLQTIKELLEKGVNVDARDPEHQSSALVWAVFHRNTEAVKLLLEFGADKNLKNNYGKNATSLAQKKGFTEIVELLKSSTAP